MSIVNVGTLPAWCQRNTNSAATQFELSSPDDAPVQDSSVPFKYRPDLNRKIILWYACLSCY